MLLFGVIAGQGGVGGAGPASNNKTLLISSDKNGTPISTASTTTFIDLTSGQRQRTSNESRACLKITKAGTLRNLRALVLTNGRSTTTNIRLRKNTADSALVIPVGAGVTGWVGDATHSESVAAGDYICASIVTGTGSGDFTQIVLQCEYEATDGAVVYHTFNANDGVSQDSAATVYNFVGGFGRGTIFGWYSSVSRSYRSTRSPIGAPGTISDLRVDVIANTSNGASVLTLFKNGSSTGLTTTIGAGSTGEFSDNTHTVTVADGDYLEWQFDTTARSSGGITLGRIEITFLSSDGSWDVLSTPQDAEDPAVNTSGVHTYVTPGGRLFPNTTEANRGIKFSFPATVSKVRGNGSTAGSGEATYDVILRDTGVDTTVAFNVPVSDSGNTLQKDTTNTHDLVADDILTVGFTPLGTVSALYSLAFTAVATG